MPLKFKKKEAILIEITNTLIFIYYKLFMIKSSEFFNQGGIDYGIVFSKKANE